MFFTIVLSIHITLCVVLIGIVLIQQGKGADAGAIMGGGTDSVLGAGAAGSALTKVTTSLAIGFMITSILLVKAYNTQVLNAASGESDVLKGSVLEPAPVEETAAADEAAKVDVVSGEEAKPADEQDAIVEADDAKPAEVDDAKPGEAAVAKDEASEGVEAAPKAGSAEKVDQPKGDVEAAPTS